MMAEENLINEEDKDYINSLPTMDEDDDDDTFPTAPYQQADDNNNAIMDQSEQEYIDNVEVDTDVFPRESPITTHNL
jgi:hypothetical protein